MKNNKIISVTVISFMLVVSPFQSSKAGWIDDWVDQKVYSGPSYKKDSKGDIIPAGLSLRDGLSKRIIY